MSLLHHETELGSYCRGDCLRGRRCNCDFDPSVCDWICTHPLRCALLAVAVIALVAIFSTPNLEIFYQ